MVEILPFFTNFVYLFLLVHMEISEGAPMISLTGVAFLKTLIFWRINNKFTYLFI